MNESTFIEQNKKQWQELEALLNSPNRDPDRLEQLFTKVSSDLSYARTFYPNRTIRIYLNSLTQRVLDLIQSRKHKFSWSLITKFYRQELPAELWRSRKALLMSLVIFIVAATIGAISTASNPDFPRVILGDAYVNMTETNINDGDPMKVYKDMEQSEMFFAITLNNIQVSFLTFIMGLFGSVGTLIILLRNGIMLGAFQFFFYQKGLFMTSFLTIWIHGTIEISAIIIAGAAGLILGDGLLNPKTYGRSLSLQVAAKRSIRILISTIPLFVIAGFLESFVTRLTGAPVIIKAGIIAASLGFIIFHYIIYPYRYQKKHQLHDHDYHVKTSGLDASDEERMIYRKPSQMLELSLAQFRLYIGSFFYRGAFPVLLSMTGIYWLWAKVNDFLGFDFYDDVGYYLLFDFSRGGAALGLAYVLAMLHLIVVLAVIYKNESVTWKRYLLGLKKWSVGILLVITPLFVIFYSFPFWATMILLLVVPPHLPFIFIYYHTQQDWSIGVALKEATSYSYNKYGQYLLAFLIVTFIYFMLWLGFTVLNSTIYDFVFSVHEIFPGKISSAVYFDCLLRIVIGSLVLLLYSFYYFNQHQSTLCKLEGIDLEDKIENFGVTA